jgi:hypothetical protein
MNDVNKKLTSEVEAVFASLRQTTLSADPYLETRVLARWQERKHARPGLSLWRRWAFASSGGAALILAISFFSWMRPATYEAIVNQPFVVRVELKALQKSAVASAMIELPDGVFFEIPRFPELRKERMLALRWSAIKDSAELPFVLSSSSAGLKRVRVSFRDEKGEVISERIFQIRLRKS